MVLWANIQITPKDNSRGSHLLRMSLHRAGDGQALLKGIP
jgi:hypothetical protein